MDRNSKQSINTPPGENTPLLPAEDTPNSTTLPSSEKKCSKDDLVVNALTCMTIVGGLATAVAATYFGWRLFDRCDPFGKLASYNVTACHDLLPNVDQNPITDSLSHAAKQVVEHPLPGVSTQRKLLASDLPIALQAQLLDAVVQGAMPTFFSILTRAGLKEWGFTENQIAALTFAANFLTLSALKGSLSEDFISTVLQSAVSAALPAVLEKTSSAISSSSVVAGASALAQWYYEPTRKTVASLMCSTLGFFAAKASLSVINNHAQEIPTSKTPSLSV